MSLFSTVIVFIILLVDAAGAATTVTGVVPFKTPSFAPSVNVVPLLSAYAAVKLGFVVAAAPDITIVMDFDVVSKTIIVSSC